MVETFRFDVSPTLAAGPDGVISRSAPAAPNRRGSSPFRRCGKEPLPLVQRNGSVQLNLLALSAGAVRSYRAVGERSGALSGSSAFRKRRELV